MKIVNAAGIFSPSCLGSLNPLGKDPLPCYIHGGGYGAAPFVGDGRISDLSGAALQASWAAVRTPLSRHKAGRGQVTGEQTGPHVRTKWLLFPGHEFLQGEPRVGPRSPKASAAPWYT